MRSGRASVLPPKHAGAVRPEGHAAGITPGLHPERPCKTLAGCARAGLTASPRPGEWGSGDDKRLLRALLASGAAQEWQPDWGGLVPGRTAAQVRPAGPPHPL
jgi:hypothetical protein